MPWPRHPSMNGSFTEVATLLRIRALAGASFAHPIIFLFLAVIAALATWVFA